MNRNTKARTLFLTMLVAALPLSRATAMARLEGSPITEAPAVRAFSANNPQSPAPSAQTARAGAAGLRLTRDDFLFVADGTRIRAHDRALNGLPQRAAWTSGRTVLSLADGPERGQLLVLDDAALHLVRFSDQGSSESLWSYPIPQRAASSAAGQLLVRDGRYVYVADPSVPGVRVLALDSAAAPTSVTTWFSPDGPVRAFSLWDRTLSVLVPSGLLLVGTGSGDVPDLSLLGRYTTSAAPTAVDANSRWAFVALGSNLLVLDIDPSSEGFLQQPVSAYDAGGTIRSLRLDKKERAYLLVNGARQIVDVGALGGR